MSLSAASPISLISPQADEFRNYFCAGAKVLPLFAEKENSSKSSDNTSDQLSSAPNAEHIGAFTTTPLRGNTVKLKAILLHLKHDESGQDLIEYALVAGLLALGAVAAMHTLSNSVTSAFGTITNSLTSNI